MIDKKIFVLSLLVLLIASLSMISAADLQGTDTTTMADHSSTDDNTIQADTTQETTKTVNKVKQTINKEATKSAKNYTDIYETLTDTNPNEDIVLSLDGEKDTYTITESITVNEAIKNLKIEGNGKIIDGQHSNQFIIINHECNLTLNNLTIQNCVAENGGAIHQRGGNLNINNSQFISNVAFMGGAIYYNNTNENSVVNIFHSTFDSNGEDTENNQYTQIGGAALIFHKGNVTIDDSTIINNNAHQGSALAIANDILSDDSGNNEPGESGETSGTSIHKSNTNLIINNSVIDSNGFIDYSGIVQHGFYPGASTQVGAVIVEFIDKVSILNSKFNDNIGLMGGALIVVGDSDLLVSNSSFEENGIPTKYYQYGADSNSAGGAIYLLTSGNTTITDSNITNNYAARGSAVYSQYYDFSSYNAAPVESETGRGTEIQESVSRLLINNSIINSNGYIDESTIVQEGYDSCLCSEKGAITIDGINQISVLNSTFENNIGIDGGALTAENYDDLLIANSSFEGNGILTKYRKYGIANEGGALYLTTSGTTTITDTNITNNYASSGSAINCEYVEPQGIPVLPGEATSRGTEIQESTSSLLINNSIINSNGYLDEGLISSSYVNGIYPCSEAGAITICDIKQITVLNSTFENNIGIEAEAIFAIGYDNLLIANSTFNNNSLPAKYIDDMLFAEVGALGLVPNGNTTITTSEFTNNGAGAGSAIYCQASAEDCNLNITDSKFDSNTGMMGGTIFLQQINASITNSNFTNNDATPYPEEIGAYEDDLAGNYGIVIFSKDTTLFINNTNFIGNGLSENLTADDVEERLVGSGIIFCKGVNDVTIDNSNFTSNRALGSGGIICFLGTYKEEQTTQQEISPKLSAIDYIPKQEDYQYGETYYYTDSTLAINHTKFEDNVITCTAELSEEGTFVPPSMGYVVLTQGNTIIDNSDFINNEVTTLFKNTFQGVEDYYYSTGVIFFYKEDYDITCNVTNSNFMFNTPANFICEDNRIVLNHTVYDRRDMLMDDGYIPDYGDVRIYVDGSDAGKYKLVSNNNNEVYVKDFTLSDEYLIKMVVNQTSRSKYYANQTFKNNAYYFRIPHDVTISVNAKTPVKIGDNTTITGKVFYTKNNGEDFVFADEEVDLYINGTYITTTKTDNSGKYEFNYTTTSIGTQKVLVTLNNSKTLPTITNTTTFDVIRRESIIKIDADNVTVGQKSVITVTLTNKENQKIKNADITLYIDNKITSLKTNENGIVKYECELPTTGLHYVSAVFDGDYRHNASSNSTSFEIYKRNSRIEVIATNTTLHEQTTIKAKLLDSNGKIIPKAQIIIYIDARRMTKETDENGEFTYEYTANTPNEKYVEVFYAGNNTFKESVNSTTFNVSKLSTTTIATPTAATIGNLTFQVIVTDKHEKTVKMGRIIIYDENGKAVATKAVDSTTTTLSITDITSGKYSFDIQYEENEMYYSSGTTSTVTIIPKANIDIEVLDNTEGNVQLEFYVTNERDEVLKQQEVTIVLPNGSSITRKTDSNGIITVTDPTAAPGKRNVLATISTTDKIIGTTKTKNLNIVPKPQETTNQNNQETTNQNNQQTTNQNNQQTTNQNNQETINQNNQNIINNYQETINNLNEKINNITNVLNNIIKQIREQENARLNQNKTTVIKVIPQNGTIGNTNVAVTLENELAQPIKNGAVSVRNSLGEVIGMGSTNNKGIVVVPVNTVAGSQNVTVVYLGGGNNNPVNSTISVTSYKDNVTVIVEAVSGVVGEDITLTARLVDSHKNAVTGGNLVFKVNGKTLRTDSRFDSDAPVWKFKVENGVVTITIKADIYLRNAKTLTASYSGSYKYNEAKSNSVVAQIKKRNAQISLSTTPRMQKSYEVITFVATVKDVTPNAKNNAMIYTNTRVIFKINGKTLKDANGNNIEVKVNRYGVASYDYVIPAGMGGIKKNGEIRDYNVTCVFVGDAYYPDTRDESFFYVERSPVTINFNKVTVNSKNEISISASIKDYKNNYVIGTNDVSIKINGRTYVNSTTNKTVIFKVVDGKINLRNLPINKNIDIKTITLVTGARQAYLDARNQTTNIVKI
ncbi:MAG: hypothetical protein BZ138_04060 [Methanosphaera sp. rholeuAM270]|nr:MAG: hypothetical protein BZ138_04060 [Methanosphaera sp. rholeuAM270]